MYRQGDIYLKPTNLKNHTPGEPQKRAILAEGEVTGHLHEVQGEQATLYGDTPEAMLLEVKEPSELTHQEHDTIVVDPGWYQVIQQRVHTPEGNRRVED